MAEDNGVCLSKNETIKRKIIVLGRHHVSSLIAPNIVERKYS